jgi:hypothetical protein
VFLTAHADQDRGDIIYGDKYSMPIDSVNVPPSESDTNAHAIFQAFDNIITPFLSNEFKSRPTFGFILACGALVTFPKSQDSLLKGFQTYVLKL